MLSFTRRLFRFSSDIMTTGGDSNYVKLSKWISNKSVCSRREAERIIDLGLVRIDGKRVFTNVLVPVDADIKTLSPNGVQRQQPIIKLWMINKPRGCICTHNDPENRPTIYSLLPKEFVHYGLIRSVGRLDYNSEGLLLLTNNSALKNLLQNPQSNMLRYYRVKVHGRLTRSKLENMSKVTTINGNQYGPLTVSVDRQLSTNSWIKVSMMGGKNREIRRIMQKNDLQVNKLIREEYGRYKIGSLKHGEIMELRVSSGLLRKTQIEVANKITKGSRTLIEIDIRSKAIEYAHQQQEFLQRKAEEEEENQNENLIE